MADTTKIVEMLWKALANLSIENDMDNIENKIFLNFKNKLATGLK